MTSERVQVVRYSVRAHSSHMHIHAHAHAHAHVHVHVHVCHVVCCFLVFGYVHCGGLVFVGFVWGFRWGILFSLDITCVCSSLYSIVGRLLLFCFVCA